MVNRRAISLRTHSPSPSPPSRPAFPSADTLSELTGVPVEGLLGADVLSLTEVTFDVPGGELVFGAGGASETWLEIPTRAFMGIPVLDITVAGESHAVFFDTGAPISYLQNADLSALPRKGGGYGWLTRPWGRPTRHGSVLLPLAVRELAGPVGP